MGISSTKNRKAAGPDQLAYEHLKLSVNVLLPYWARLYNSCISLGNVPKCWRSSTLFVLYKAKGSILSPDAYRGIAMQCCSYKVLCKILANRLYDHCIDQIPHEQFGFLRHRSTLDAIEVLLTFVRENLAFPRNPVYAVYIDYRKAFDSVDRRYIIKTLIEMNVTGPILRLISEIMSYNLVSVFDGLQCSRPFIQNTGVPQGDSMSPILFVLITVGLINYVKNMFPGVSILMFADDAVLYSTTLEPLQNALNYVSMKSRMMNLDINVEKTKCMKFRNGGRLARNDTILLNGRPLDFVSEFTYLGVTLTTSGMSFTKHVRERSRKAVICAMSSIKNPRTLSIETALKLFELKVAPIATYGLKLIWEFLTLDNLFMLDRVKCVFLKRLLSVSPYSRNRLVYLIVGCPTFIEDLQRLFNLPATPVFNSFLQEYDEKFAEIDPVFYSTPVMTQQLWREPMATQRHVVTRHGVHGFHFRICINQVFHDANENCICMFCDSLCTQYHFLSCQANPMSLSSVADVS
jgi:hypothetical protein